MREAHSRRAEPSVTCSTSRPCRIRIDENPRISSLSHSSPHIILITACMLPNPECYRLIPIYIVFIPPLAPSLTSPHNPSTDPSTEPVDSVPQAYPHASRRPNQSATLISSSPPHPARPVRPVGTFPRREDAKGRGGQNGCSRAS